ncbi:hypothetical protein PR048_032741 [Dryococelus australis]|uniref:Uncharacterized protein n=1 Tax=Dryococelus australis TaxID=614101 RepID=A0ABQ9G760_9NEOP|nr:hypothetical protein PR048_032741 [Dryococelus australis]
MGVSLTSSTPHVRWAGLLVCKFGRRGAAAAHETMTAFPSLVRHIDNVTPASHVPPECPSRTSDIDGALLLPVVDLGEPGLISGGSLPDFRMWESCRTMPLVDGFSRGISYLPWPCVPALLHTHLATSSSALMTSMLRAAQVSSLAHIFFSPRGAIASTANASSLPLLRLRNTKAVHDKGPLTRRAQYDDQRRLTQTRYLPALSSTYSHGCPIAWPARSPDSTPLDFFLWVHMKDVIYQTSVEPEEDLPVRIMAVACLGLPGIGDRVYQNMVRVESGIRQIFFGCLCAVWAGISRRSPVSPALSFRRCSILTSLHPRPFFKISMLRAAQVSSFTPYIEPHS